MDLIEKTDSNYRHPWELARLDVVNDLIKSKINTFKNKNILDLGCGDLFFIKEFAKNKIATNFYAVDTAFDSNFISKNDEKRLKLFQNFNEISEKELVFDVIFLMDVLEHIKDDLSFLSNLVASEMVNKDTIFIITVPAFQTLFSSHDHFLKHYRRYNNFTMEKLTISAGLQTLDKGYFFFSLLLPRMVEVAREKMKDEKTFRKGTKLTDWNKNAYTSNKIKNFLMCDYKLQKTLKNIGIQLPGLSNYIVCKRLV